MLAPTAARSASMSSSSASRATAASRRVLDGGAALGDDPGDPLGVLGERLDPDEQQVAQGVAELAGAAAGLEGDDEFLDEEGVAVGAFEDLVDEAGSGSAARMPVSWRRTSARVKRASSMRRTVRSRSSSARSGRSGWRRWMSSAR